MWNNDGPTEDVNSLSILLRWITAEGNYNRYRGDIQHGKTKSAIAGEIVSLMEGQGIAKSLTAAKDVMTKICSLEYTGAGIEDEATLKAAVTKRCRFYYELESAMMKMFYPMNLKKI